MAMLEERKKKFAAEGLFDQTAVAELPLAEEYLLCNACGLCWVRSLRNVDTRPESLNKNQEGGEGASECSISI